MKQLFISIALVVAMFFVAQPVFAQTATQQSQKDTCKELREKFDAAGGGTLVNSLPVYCSEGGVFNKIVSVLYWFVGIIAVIAIIYGGYIYMTAGSNEAAAKKGRQILLYTAAGVAVVLLASTIVYVVSRFLVDNSLF